MLSQGRLAPIALFAYNRPLHLQRLLDSLIRNPLADKSEMFVFCDGARRKADEESVRDVRFRAHSVRGFRSVHVIERDHNLGLSASVISGINETLKRFDRVIVLEDDLVLSQQFLEFINDALEYYATEERVMHVSGYMFPILAEGLPDTVFFRATTCWGWGTWKRAWRFFQEDADLLYREIGVRGRRRFNVEGTYPFIEDLDSQRKGKIDSWAIRWYASVFLQQGLCLHPSKSLVQNTGSDGSGVHSNVSNAYDVELKVTPLKNFESVISEHPLALHRIKEFNRNLQRPFLERVSKRLLKSARLKGSR